MGLWTNEEINRILLRLDEMGLPFAHVTPVLESEKIRILGKSRSSIVCEVCRRGNQKKRFALKVIGFSDQNENRQTFEKTVFAQKKLGFINENIVRIYDYTTLWVAFDKNVNVINAGKEEPVGSDGNVLRLHFILMEKLTPVMARTGSGKPETVPEALGFGDEGEILKLAFDIAGVLKAAHKKNILHRDVKPENVFYSEKKKRYYLGDFGIAKETKDGFAETVVFTNGYAAPEVRSMRSNDRYDNTADIYSFGMMLFVFANKLRFPDSDIYKAKSDTQYLSGYVLPKPDNDGISEEFYRIVSKACMYDPMERYASMDEMLSDIETLMYDERVNSDRARVNTCLAAGAILAALGTAVCKLTLFPEAVVDLPMLQFLFFSCGIAGNALLLAKKKTKLTTLLLLALGIAIFIKDGFTWGGLILLFMMLYSTEYFAGVAGICVFSAVFVSALQGYDPSGLQVDSRYCWVGFIMLSVSRKLLLQYSVLKLEDRHFFTKQNRYFSMKQYSNYPALYFPVYLVIWFNSVTGMFSRPFAVSLFAGLGSLMEMLGIPTGSFIAEMIRTSDLTAFSICGMVLCVIWYVTGKMTRSDH